MIDRPPAPAGATPARTAAQRAAGVHPEPVIEVAGLGKCYHVYDRPIDRFKQAVLRGRRLHREFWALRGVSLTLRPGEALGIIGRNGSGKSTLLQVLAGTLAPTEGRVTVRGKVAALLELGAGFNKEFTGRENVYIAGALRGLSRAEIDTHFPDIVAFADIGDFVDQPVKTYSSGMYVRLAFAVSAHVRPEVLVIDEALAVGDVFFQQKCHRFMADRLRDTTRIVVSHDLRAVASLCERVIVLDHGRMVFEGQPREAIAFYTGLVHRQHFGASSPSPLQGTLTGPNSPGVQAPAEIDWVELRDPHSTGPITLERVALTDPSGRAVGVLKPGDSYLCFYMVHAREPLDALIFGVMVNDRLGTPICGDNTVSLEDGLVTLPSPGRYVVRLEYRWPELQPGDYTATFGVGRGTDALHHDVLSWAQNAVAIRAISPSRPVHGVFNNPVRGLEVTPVEPA
ncbi:MAG: ABC transporter ATP-binding protein [Phycisphaerales bacterium]